MQYHDSRKVHHPDTDCSLDTKSKNEQIPKYVLFKEQNHFENNTSKIH